MKLERIWIRCEKASATIEASVIIPICLMVCILLINLAAIMYNRQTLIASTSTCVLHAVQMEHAGQNKIQSEIEEELKQQLSTRLLFHPQVKQQVSVNLLRVKVTVEMSQGLVGKELLHLFRIKDVAQFSYSCSELRCDPAKLIWELERGKDIKKQASKRREEDATEYSK